jgi:hypothetical protein
MGKKVFVSYKYGDNKVKKLGSVSSSEETTVRHYVDTLQKLLDENDHINKGEQDGEDLSSFKDSTIASKLRNKIYDSSVTIVIVSKGMKDRSLSEDEQWIPWEISYSLKEHSRDGRTSKTNAMLAVVLPDKEGSYGYYIEDESCPYCKCRTLKTDFLFKLMKENMFNVKEPKYDDCDQHGNSKVYLGFSSYIHSVKWDDFHGEINRHIQTAIEINDKIDCYNITKTVV